MKSSRKTEARKKYQMKCQYKLNLIRDDQWIRLIVRYYKRIEKWREGRLNPVCYSVRLNRSLVKNALFHNLNLSQRYCQSNLRMKYYINFKISV